MLRAFKRVHQLVFFQLEHEYFPDIVAKAGVIAKDASNEVLSDELVPVDEVLEVNFK